MSFSEDIAYKRSRHLQSQLKQARTRVGLYEQKLLFENDASERTRSRMVLRNLRSSIRGWETELQRYHKYTQD